ncbi:MAG: type IV secretion system DNA-binding domain-containing protein [Phycisphaerae bacterium]|nr:type IV secretion system DNA-binding domain-containing protein [Phycisphaerae bacterium]
MSVTEQVLLARAYSFAQGVSTIHYLMREGAKGCTGDISAVPIPLEPPYEAVDPSSRPYHAARRGSDASLVIEHPEDFVRLKIWISPEQRSQWIRSELFLKLLYGLHRRAAFEILGNSESILFYFVCHRDEAPIVLAAFGAQFELCTLSLAPTDGYQLVGLVDAGAQLAFRDYFPSPPYSRLLTRPDELVRSPYLTLLTALAALPSHALGLYQVVFEPTAPDHNWHRNVELLQDREYQAGAAPGLTIFQRYGQQAPSVDLRHMAMDLVLKAHNDKPFFAAGLRIAVCDPQQRAAHWLRSVAVAAHCLQHGGRPLNYITEQNYSAVLGSVELAKMFSHIRAYRHGFLVNSAELTSMVHIPPPQNLEHIENIVPLLETLPSSPSLSQGTLVGTCAWADDVQEVRIPQHVRSKHTHVIGGTGTGKSTLLEWGILQDIERGHGVAVLDPHGRLVQRLSRLIPMEQAERVIYFDPGDPEWVPIWNPLRCGAAVGHSRIADDLVGAFKSFMSGWGDRLEHLLRHAFFAVLHLPDGSLLDVSDLLRKKSADSRHIRQQLENVLVNEVARRFWREDFDGYGQPDLSPPQHKLSKLLASETVGAMLSQHHSAINFHSIMDAGHILLLDLSTIGTEAREILGCFMLSLLHLTALGRGSGPGHQNRPFHIYCDEAHRFLTDSVEDLIAETRKFDVSLTLAHQYMSQFGTRKTDALSGVGSTIIYRVDRRDAQYLRKDLQGRVDVEDLSTLDVGSAIVRIGNEITRVRTRPPLAMPQQNARDRIIALSRERYCRRMADVQPDIHFRRRHDVFVRTSRDRGPSRSQTHRAATSTCECTPHEGRGAAGAFDYDTY